MKTQKTSKSQKTRATPQKPTKTPPQKTLRKVTLYLIALFCVLHNVAFGASYVPLSSKNGLVMSSSDIANKIGQDVLDSGGNAIDAAVAVGYALAVVHPAAGNLSGGGFALIHLANGKSGNGRNLALDFRERAPIKASKDMYLDSKKEVIKNAAVIGYRSIATPGSVKGFSEMLSKYGTKKLSELIAPSIEVAKNGFVVSSRQSETMLEAQSDFAKFPESRQYFLKKNGDIYREGDVLVQKDLAHTLRILARQGERAFYKGEIARAMISQIQKNGGLLSMEDLANYKVTWREPVRGSYRGYEIISMPPPSSGGAHIIEILNVLESADVGAMGFASSESIHFLAEAMRQAYADRAEFMGDSDFVSVPLSEITSKEYGRKIYESIKDSKKAIPSDSVRAGMGVIESGSGLDSKNRKNRGYESRDTTHFSVVDKFGNAVSITYTLNKRYGSAVAVGGYGFLLNDQMENFSLKSGYANRHGLIEGENNAIEPLKRPLSSMSPTMILKDGKLFMVLGTPGSGKIISTIVQVIVNVLDYKMDIAEAVQVPRFHTQWQPDVLYVEKFLLNKDTQRILENMGYKIESSDYMGDVNAITINRDGSGEGSLILQGSLDPRRKL